MKKKKKNPNSDSKLDVVTTEASTGAVCEKKCLACIISFWFIFQLLTLEGGVLTCTAAHQLYGGCCHVVYDYIQSLGVTQPSFFICSSETETLSMKVEFYLAPVHRSCHTYTNVNETGLVFKKLLV